MKRPINKEDSDPATSHPKKIKPDPYASSSSAAAVLSDDNLLYEVLRHADARTLGVSACVSKQWRVTARDDRLWEMICTRHYSSKQLRPVVTALGGFRDLYVDRLSKPSVSVSAAATSSSAWPCLPPSHAMAVPREKGWGKDEVQLSVALLSINYFKKMNFGNKGKGI